MLFSFTRRVQSTRPRSCQIPSAEKNAEHLGAGHLEGAIRWLMISG